MDAMDRAWKYEVGHWIARFARVSQSSLEMSKFGWLETTNTRDGEVSQITIVNWMSSYLVDVWMWIALAIIIVHRLYCSNVSDL